MQVTYDSDDIYSMGSAEYMSECPKVSGLTVSEYWCSEPDGRGLIAGGSQYVYGEQSGIPGADAAFLAGEEPVAWAHVDV